MPCRSPYDDEPVRIYVENPDDKKRVAELTATNAKMKAELDTLTRLLCTLCRFNPMIYDRTNAKFLSVLQDEEPFKELYEWYKEHLEVDRRRQRTVNVEFYKKLHPELSDDEIVRLLGMGVIEDKDADPCVDKFLKYYGYKS